MSCGWSMDVVMISGVMWLWKRGKTVRELKYSINRRLWKWAMNGSEMNDPTSCPNDEREIMEMNDETGLVDDRSLDIPLDSNKEALFVVNLL